MKKLWFVLILIGGHWKSFAMEINFQQDHPRILQFFGKYILEIDDKTGKFSPFERDDFLTSTQKILFDYKLEGEYPLRIEDGIFNEGAQKLTPVLHFSDIVKFEIDQIKSESIIQIMAIDEFGNKEILYHCPKNEEFHNYFVSNIVYKCHFRIMKFKYHLIPHIPDSLFFLHQMVKNLLENQFYQYMETDLLYDDSKIRKMNLRAFYNRHGIILNLNGPDLDYFSCPRYNCNKLCFEMLKHSQNGECLYMNPTDKKINLKEYTLTTYNNYHLKLFQVRCNKTLSSLSLIFTKDRCFLNGEPATIMNRDEVIELWGNCSSFLS